MFLRRTCYYLSSVALDMSYCHTMYCIIYGISQLFQLCSIANSNFSFHVSFFQVNCIKIQTMSLVLNLSEISAEILCDWFTLTSSFASDWKKVQANWTYFSVARMKQKHVVLCSNWYWACSDILSYSCATFSRLMEIRL